MQNTESTKIVTRMFSALARLKDDGVIRGKKTFTDHAAINRRNFFLLEKDMTRDIFQPEWLAVLTSDYKVSPLWLLTGEGAFYRDGWDAETAREYAQTCKKRATEK